jgi:hypothetical protein
VKRREFEMTSIPKTFAINRQAKNGIHWLREVFGGLEYSPVFMKLLGTEEDVSKFLEGAHVRVSNTFGYMYIDPSDGYVVVSQKYLQEGEPENLYLDIIHELVHVKQWHDGMDLYDRRYSYVERPTEVEAYALVVVEAKRIGMVEKEIIDYLDVPWISKNELEELAKTVGVEKQGSTGKKEEF